MWSSSISGDSSKKRKPLQTPLKKGLLKFVIRDIRFGFLPTFEECRESSETKSRENEKNDVLLEKSQVIVIKNRLRSSPGLWTFPLWSQFDWGNISCCREYWSSETVGVSPGI